MCRMRMNILQFFDILYFFPSAKNFWRNTECPVCGKEGYIKKYLRKPNLLVILTLDRA
jgi:hypothetical protein